MTVHRPQFNDIVTGTETSPRPFKDNHLNLVIPI